MSREYLMRAYRIAAMSRDPSTQNGAILVSRHGADAAGYNDFPFGVDRIPSRDVGREKLRYTLHAEEDAILSAAASGIETGGATLFACWAPCGHCALVIIGAAVSRLVTSKRQYDATPERWKAEVDFGLSLLREAGVDVEMFDGELPDAPEIRFDGRLFKP